MAARGLAGSNPAPTNLIVTSRETNSVQDLKKKMIDLCQQRGLPYGIMIRKMDFPSTAPLDEARKMLAGAAPGGTAVSMPLYVYRLYPDGHEELIRGVRLRGLNARSLKDILAAGERQHDASITLKTERLSRCWDSVPVPPQCRWWRHRF